MSVDTDLGHASLPKRDRKRALQAITLMYDNAHKRKGAAHGTISLGPTVSSNPALTGPLKLGHNSSKGPFWHVPEDESARKWDFPLAKRDAMAQIEALWRVTVAEVLLMPELRPEESLCIPLRVLNGLVMASREAMAAEAGLEEMQEVMGEEQRRRWEVMRERGQMSVFNITEEDLKNVTKRFSKRLEEVVLGDVADETESTIAVANSLESTIFTEAGTSGVLPFRPKVAEHKRQKSSGSSWASMRPPAKTLKVGAENASGTMKATAENKMESFLKASEQELSKLREEIKQLRKENQELARRLWEKERT